MFDVTTMNEKLFTKFGCLHKIYISLCLFFLFLFWKCWRLYLQHKYLLLSSDVSFSNVLSPKTFYKIAHFYNSVRQLFLFICNKYKERVMALTTEQYFSYNWIIHAPYNETDIPIFESTRHNSN